MTVRAKFRVEAVKRTTAGYEVDLFPVTSGSTENAQFYKFTPAGSIKLSTVNAEAGAQFEPGDEFYVDFAKAPKPA